MDKLAKAELHVHFEGSAPPSVIKRLAEHHKIKLPLEIFGPDDTFAWQDFLHFLKVYDIASSVIRTPEDYRDVTYEYLMASAAQGVIYCELMPSIDHAEAVGLSYQSFLEGIVQGIQEAREKSGIESCIYISGIRHYGVESCERVAQLLYDNPHPLVRGFGLGGDEINFPGKWFTRAFAIARDAGLGCTVHAGEVSGAESVREAIELLHVKRIGHGVRSIEDPALLVKLAEEEITLEVCPTSNISLRIYPNFAQHPLRKLHEAGVKVTLNSDDPPYFNASIGREYQIAKDHFGLDAQTLLQFTRQAIQAGFIDDAKKTALLLKCS